MSDDEFLDILHRWLIEQVEVIHEKYPDIDGVTARAAVVSIATAKLEGCSCESIEWRVDDDEVLLVIDLEDGVVHPMPSVALRHDTHCPISQREHAEDN